MKPYTMFRNGWGILLFSLVLASVLGALVARGTLESQAAQPATATAVSAEVEAAAGPSIDSPSPTCYRPVAGTGACYIQWNYLNVTADSGSYIISTTVTINNRLRAYHSGFFQSSMFIPEDMTAPGYRVACGPPGSGNIAGLGQTYPYVIRARETSGLSAANAGSITCPADIVAIFLPLIQRH